MAERPSQDRSSGSGGVADRRRQTVADVRRPVRSGAGRPDVDVARLEKVSQTVAETAQNDAGIFCFQSFLHFVPLFLGFVLSDFAEGKIFFNHRIVAFVYFCVIVTFLNCMGFNL